MASNVLVSCDLLSRDPKETTAAETTAATIGTTAETVASTVATTAATTAQTTTATTVATTTGGPTIPQSLAATVNREDMNLTISHLQEPITVHILPDDPFYGDVTIDLSYQGWPTICKGEGNTIYAVSSVRTHHIDPMGAIGFSKSTDGGQTWSDLRIIKDTPLDDRDAGIVDLGNGYLMITWFTHGAKEYYQAGGKYLGYRKSYTDEQKNAIDTKLNALVVEDANAEEGAPKKSLGASYVAPRPMAARRGESLLRSL